MCRISIHRDFDSLGGPLSPCGSHLLRSEPFTQIRSRTLCQRKQKIFHGIYWKGIKQKGGKRINQDLSIDAWDVIEKSCFLSVYLIS